MLPKALKDKDIEDIKQTLSPSSKMTPVYPYKSYVIGVDPGINGGVCLLNAGTGTIINVRRTPVIQSEKNKIYDMSGIRDLFLSEFPSLVNLSINAFYASSVVALERQQAMPKQGVKSTFSTGYGFGMWKMLIATIQASSVDIQPREWQVMLKGMSCPDDTKIRSIVKAKELFPKVNLVPSGGRKDHDGMADSVNIASYVWLRMKR